MCAFTHRLLAAPKVPPSLRIYAHLPFVSIMADWMNEMANAVEEAEAANARAQEEVATEPMYTPRVQHEDDPGSPRWVDYSFQASNMVLVQNLRGSRSDSFSMMALFLKKNMKSWHEKLQ